jgi:MGT family glycosyltransferase
MTRPRRFLFAAWPFPGHFFPLIAIAHALARRGHACAFYTGAQAAPIVQQEGFECFLFRHLNEDAIDRLMQTRPDRPWRPRAAVHMGLLLRRWLLDTVPQQVADLEPVIATWRPDVIGADPTMWAPPLVIFEKHRIDVAICSFIPACTLPGPDAPPWGRGLPRAGGWRAQAARCVARRVNALAATQGRRAANAIRRAHGLPPLATSVTEHTGRMPLYLVPSTREFDYDRHDLPSRVHYVGPYLWNRPRTEAPTPWVVDLGRERPCVHVTEGTVHVHEPVVLSAAVTGLAGLPMDVVITTGTNRTTPAIEGPALSNNIRIASWVSHSDLLPRTSVMVTTGGAGSVLTALAHGVPLVIVPTEWDKPEIAQRVVEAGAGVRLAPQECTATRLRACVRAVLDEPRFRVNARRLADSFAKSGGAERAAELLLDLAQFSPAPD